MKVKVYLNREQDEKGRSIMGSRFGEDRYQAGDHLEEVYSYETFDVPHTSAAGDYLYAPQTPRTELEVVYALLNRGSGTFVGDFFYHERSLDVGDIVEIDGVRYSCEPVGWKEVTA